MGLDSNGTKFLLYAHLRQGVSFENMAMIGRQTLNLTAEQLQSNLQKFEIQGGNANEILKAADGFSEPFIKLLDAEKITSFDASDFENATEVHDFNRPISEKFRNKFTTVLDGGTLEHIFNFPAAIKNCMQMVKVGGHFLSITPTNNFLGHGFYQFSPELFYRVFTAQNGFKVRQMILFEDYPNSDWYEVTDPDTIKHRVLLANFTPSYLLTIAEKTADVKIFEKPPQQSDYFAMWENSKNNNSDVPKSFNDNAVKNPILRLPKSAFIHLRRKIGRRFGELPTKSHFYKKLDI